MKKEIIINLDVEGFHYWEDAPLVVSFLKDSHRHIFKIKVGIEVTDSNREKEFFIEQWHLKEWFGEAYGVPAHFKSMSCEMIAEEVLEFIPYASWCEVWEDNENGARVTR